MDTSSNNTGFIGLGTIIFIVIVGLIIYFVFTGLSSDDSLTFDLDEYNRWEDEPKKLLTELSSTSKLGSPSTQDKDFVEWNKKKLENFTEGKCWDKFVLKNELIPVSQPFTHNDFFYGYLTMDLSPNSNVANLSKIYNEDEMGQNDKKNGTDNKNEKTAPITNHGPPIKYLSDQKMLEIRSNSINGLVAKAYLAYLMLTGTEVEDWNAKYNEVMLQTSKDHDIYTKYIDTVCKYKKAGKFD